MDLKFNYSKIINELHQAAIAGNLDDVTNCINIGISIYKQTDFLETPLHLALMNQHTEIAKLLWSIYESDLKFVHESLKFLNKLWITSPILIGCGSNENTKIDQLFSDYQNYEVGCELYQTNCVLILLKRDNFTPNRVLCLSPKTKTGKMLVVQMIKCLISNGLLDVHQLPRNKISLVQASAAAGMMNIYNTLVNYENQGNSVDIGLCAIEFGQGKFLEEYYYRFPINMYSFFQSYCIKILHSDKWDIIKYFAEKIIMEKQMTWKDILNFRIPSTSSTLFFYIIQNSLMEIAENLLAYDPNLNAEDKHGRNPMCYLQWNVDNFPKYRNFIMKAIELDPHQLCVKNEELCSILHKLVASISLTEVIQIYEKYPKAKDIFFKVRLIALECIETMALHKQYETIKFVIDSSREQIDSDLLYSIITKLTVSDDIKLFEYVMTNEDFDFSTEDSIHNLNPLLQAIKYRSLNVFKLMLSKVNSNQLKAIHDSTYSPSYNLLLYSIIYSNPELNTNLNWISGYTKTMERLKPSTNDNVIDNIEFNHIFDVMIENGVSYEEIYETYNLLDIAVMADNIHVVQKLLQLGFQINSHDETAGKQFPIDFAQNVQMFQLLNSSMPISYITNIDLKNRLSPLHRFVADEPTDRVITLIEYILNNGGNIDEIDQFGKSAIFYVRHIDIAKCLLKYKPNLDLVDSDNITPIHHAFAERRYDLGYYLLEQKMVEYSFNINDLPYLKPFFEDKNTVVDFNTILEPSQSIFRNYLEKYCNAPYTLEIPLIFDAIRFNDELAKVLLMLPNLDIFALDPYTQNTILHTAAQYEKIDFVDQLMKRGLQIECYNAHGDTPFSLYCRHSAELGYESIMKFLNFNPEVNIKNDCEMSPILYASVKDTTGDVICELLTRGANIMDREPDNGPTAYENMTCQLQRIFKFLI